MLADKIRLDFQVLCTKDRNPKIMSIVDQSIWGRIANKPSIIEIVVPGFKDPVVHYFNKNEVNLFNSVMLNLNCTEVCGKHDFLVLPDGVYKITLKGSPDTYRKERHYLRTEELELELDKLYINSNILCEQKDYSLITLIERIEFLIQAAEANMRYNNICKSQELLFKAQELVERAKGCSGGLCC